ncbi:MAG TPA: aminotransferase class I/II-fold pyridoxal phosphate-dependent enzyme [Clostridiaceae bacterium]|nr:aminotransferase class I/II-fold pyridoxal phosphate-dependent enzyme [Clostridiaceae bacterium]
MIKGLELYAKEKNTLFHMPGHKQMEALEEIQYLKEHLLHLDVTEVPGTDNMHYPEGVIMESLELLSEAMGSKKSYYLVNGSTSGNYAMIMGLFNKGDSVIIQRNCHQSVYNAIGLSGIQPVFVQPSLLPRFHIPSCVTLEAIRKAFESHPHVKGIVLTSPSYFGIMPDLKGIALFCREKNLRLVVDEAHGAHLGFSKRLPGTALSQGAHASTCSFHKTLTSFTQSAVLNLGEGLTSEEIGRVEYYLRVFQSSSPSYILMASLEMARYLMETRGEALLSDLLENIDELKESLKDLTDIRFLTDSDLEEGQMDPTRVTLSTPLDGTDLSGILRKDFHIQVEMTEGECLVFLTSIMNSREDFLHLATSLKDIFGKTSLITSTHEASGESSSPMSPLPEPITLFSERETLFMGCEEVRLEDAAGRVSRERITPYPPGVPILLPGEVISVELIAYLKDLNGRDTVVLRSGSQDRDKVLVLKQDIVEDRAT